MFSSVDAVWPHLLLRLRSGWTKGSARPCPLNTYHNPFLLLLVSHGPRRSLLLPWKLPKWSVEEGTQDVARNQDTTWISKDFPPFKYFSVFVFASPTRSPLHRPFDNHSLQPTASVGSFSPLLRRHLYPSHHGHSYPAHSYPCVPLRVQGDTLQDPLPHRQGVESYHSV